MEGKAAENKGGSSDNDAEHNSDDADSINNDLVASTNEEEYL
jgi:hypothetical protein